MKKKDTLSSTEIINKIILKNDQFYIVKNINNNNHLVKIDNLETVLDDLPDELYCKAYKPEVLKILIKNETGRESKFGGSKPFFIMGEKWPSYNKYYMTFFCQFKDPREQDNILYRVFILLDDDGICDKYWISKIELSEENIKNQIILEKPKVKKYFADSNTNNKFKPYKIVSWINKKELVSFEKIRKYFGINDYQYHEDNRIYNQLSSIFYDHKYGPSSGVKVGGTPLSTQDHEFVQNYDLIQLEYTTFLPYGWGDSGIAHVSKDLKFTWDCC